jgi:ketosteroid isomerase-like protein
VVTAEQVLETHQTFNRALTTHDVGALTDLYANDYMLVRPDGSVLSKEQVLRDLQVGGLTFKSIDVTSISIRLYGETALLTGESRTISSRAGTDAAAHIRLLAVYVLDHGRVRLAHFQSVSLPL